MRHWVTRAASCPITPFDLHVLGTPPAFVLSQDQTLRNIMKSLRFPFTDRLGSNRVRCSPGSACAARVMRFHLYDVTSHGMFLFSFQRAKTFSLPLSQQELHLTSFFALCQLPFTGKKRLPAAAGKAGSAFRFLLRFLKKKCTPQFTQKV